MRSRYISFDGRRDGVSVCRCRPTGRVQRAVTDRHGYAAYNIVRHWRVQWFASGAFPWAFRSAFGWLSHAVPCARHHLQHHLGGDAIRPACTGWDLPGRCRVPSPMRTRGLEQSTALLFDSAVAQHADGTTFEEFGDVALGDKPLAQAFPAAAAQINAHFGGF